VLLVDADGIVRWANDAVLDRLGPDADDPIGRPEDVVLNPLHADRVHRVALPDGWGATYLEPADTADARYLSEVSAGLTGVLNVGRTLGRFADLVVPRLGTWCAVRVLDAQGLRLSVCDGSSRPRHRYVPAREATLPVPGEDTVADAEDLEVLGADPEIAAALVTAGPVHTATRTLRALGEDLGALTVVRSAAQGPFPPGDLVLLEEVARRGASALAAAGAYEERTLLAATLRNALLQPALPQIPGVELGARYRASAEATEIGGDFYQVYGCPHGHWAFEIGDVCGKGVEAAVLTGQVRQSLRTAVLVNDEPDRALDVLNQAMLSVDGTRFVTLVHGRLHAADDGGVEVSLAGGGHPRPLLLHLNGRVETVETGGTIVGMLKRAKFRTTQVRLAPGETLLLYTDGVTEARIGEEQLGPERLEAMLADCVGMPAQATAERIEQLVLDYLAGGAHDDIALLAIRAEG
jgi:hypothetical protein